MNLYLEVGDMLGTDVYLLEQREEFLTKKTSCANTVRRTLSSQVWAPSQTSANSLAGQVMQSKRGRKSPGARLTAERGSSLAASSPGYFPPLGSLCLSLVAVHEVLRG